MSQQFSNEILSDVVLSNGRENGFGKIIDSKKKLSLISLGLFFIVGSVNISISNNNYFGESNDPISNINEEYNQLDLECTGLKKLEIDANLLVKPFEFFDDGEYYHERINEKRDDKNLTKLSKKILESGIRIESLLKEDKNRS